jgi:hypothetical protein
VASGETGGFAVTSGPGVNVVGFSAFAALAVVRHQQFPSLTPIGVDGDGAFQHS